jgi:hypothetical protein
MGVKNYLSVITNGRGMAKSNTYSVNFVLTPKLQEHLQAIGRGNGFNAPVRGNSTVSTVGARILIMCDEVSLPGIQSNTGSIVGRYLGQGPIYYPTAPIYSDMQLSFMCDAEMQAFKFLLDWHTYIYDTESGSGIRKGEKVRRLKYPENYQCEMIIEKRERNNSDEIGVTTIGFRLFNAWPYSVDSIPLSYGSSQLVKCTANFYYSSWDRNPIKEAGLPWPTPK